MSKTNAVAEVKNNALVGAEEFAGLAGEGFGETSSSDFVIPRIGLLGELSPQLKKSHAKYLAGSEVGDLVDSALGEVLAKGYNGETIHLLPVKRVKEVLEWKPRTAGGGLVSREPLVGNFEDYAKKRGAKQDAEKYEFKLANGNELIETVQLYCLDLTRDAMPVFVPWKKSNIKVFKPWFTKRANTKFPGTQNALPLLFRTIYLGSFEDSGNNNTWANFTITDGPSLPEMGDYSDIKAAAEGFLEILKSGNFVADDEQDHGGSSDDSEIPF
jgi:hypothetical protein